MQVSKPLQPVSWLGPYDDVRKARKDRDAIRQAGGYALVYRSTVGIRAQVKAWLATQTTKEN